MMPTKTFYFCVGLNVFIILINLVTLATGNYWALGSVLINGAVIAFMVWRRTDFLKKCKETIDGWEEQSNL